jgi:NAD(P)-dependent dehydrogenase (short-subunit alcohol dehydrogenase family)
MSRMKRFVITGGSRGIGLSCAKMLLAQGRKVIIVSRSAPPEKIDAEFISADLSNEATTLAAIEQIKSIGPIDGVVNNVGVTLAEKLEAMSWAELSRVMELNVRPAVLFTQAGIEHMKQARWGRIINIGSMLIAGSPNRSSYAAAKSALMSFTRTWAVECAESGITVNAVCPGATETELFRKNNPRGSAGELKYIQGAPLKRLASPDEIASAVAYFASDLAGFCTGQILFVDGGTMVGRSFF